MPSLNQFGPAGLSIPTTAFSTGGRGSEGFPIMTAVLEAPAWLDPMGASTSRVNRMHSQALTWALRETMKKHHQTRVWQHFNRFRQRKYGFSRRYVKYLIRKARIGVEGAETDLVKTAKTKRFMRNRIRIRVHGRGGGRTVTGQMKWPPGHKERAGQIGITKRIMADEIARFTLREERSAAEDLVAFYIQRIDELTRRQPRVRRRLSGRLGSLGISV